MAASLKGAAKAEWLTAYSSELRRAGAELRKGLLRQLDVVIVAGVITVRNLLCLLAVWPAETNNALTSRRCLLEGDLLSRRE